MRIRSYKDLIAWQRCIDLAVACYDCTRLFPINERYCLTQQIRRAGISVPANIAEGQGRYHRPKFLHHFSYSRGSVQEVETFLTIAERLRYRLGESGEIVIDLCAEVNRLLAGLRRSLI